MSCSAFDWKSYVLGETPPAERPAHEAHLAACLACRAEAESLGVTVAALGSLPQAEPPRRIAFVSDPVLLPNWWQRFWNSGPQLGFAAAGLLSLAILVHAWVGARPTGAPQPEAVALNIEQRVEQEVARRLPELVRAEVAALDAARSESGKLALASFEQKLEARRAADLQDVKEGFRLLQRQLGNLYVSASRMGGD
jgi:hypothetical protein